MKNHTTPRTLADSAFVVGYSSAPTARRLDVGSAVGVLLAVIIGVIGAALLVHFLAPCEAGALCTFGACGGPCKQGREVCQCPDDCQLPDDGSAQGVGLAILLASAFAVVGFAFWVVAL